MDGLAYLLSIFDRNLRDSKELVDIIKRLHIAYYEEARLLLKRALEEGFIDCRDDTQVTLKGVIAKYGS